MPGVPRSQLGARAYVHGRRRLAVIGFVLSAAVLLVRVHGGPATRLAELFLFTFVATVDTCLVVIARPRAGRSCFTAGTDHTSHRLRLMGLSVRQVALALFAVAALSCLCGVGVTRAWLPGAGTLVVAVAVAVAVTVILLLLRIPAYAVQEGAAPEPSDPRTAPARASRGPGVKRDTLR